MHTALLVDVHQDPDAAAVVREHDGGDELVPTVDVGGALLNNPGVPAVRTALRG